MRTSIRQPMSCSSLLYNAVPTLPSNAAIRAWLLLFPSFSRKNIKVLTIVLEMLQVGIITYYN